MGWVWYVVNSYHTPAYINFCGSLHCLLEKIDLLKVSSSYIFDTFSFSVTFPYFLFFVYTETYRLLVIWFRFICMHLLGVPYIASFVFVSANGTKWKDCRIHLRSSHYVLLQLSIETLVTLLYVFVKIIILKYSV
jgi:hypothetical protein